MARRTEVPFGDNASDTAVLLLAAAEALGLDQAVVKTGTGVFIVPTEVADAANQDLPAPEEEAEPEQSEETVEKQAPKRAAKKTAKKK